LYVWVASSRPEPKKLDASGSAVCLQVVKFGQFGFRFGPRLRFEALAIRKLKVVARTAARLPNPDTIPRPRPILRPGALRRTQPFAAHWLQCSTGPPFVAAGTFTPQPNHRSDKGSPGRYRSGIRRCAPVEETTLRKPQTRPRFGAAFVRRQSARVAARLLRGRAGINASSQPVSAAPML
jgi:hypothetical protein